MEFPYKVSVLLVTYNHEKYIAEALESVIMQKHDYPFEIIIADDHSTDNTIEIIKGYASKHPEITFLPVQPNLGITKNYKRGFDACQGEYVAVLEGDDYWTSPHKIAQMVEFLDNNRGCSIAFNRFIVSEAKSKKYNIQPWPIHDSFQLITISDLIQDNMIGNFSTCMYRNEIIRKIDPKLFEMKVYDWMFNMAMAQFGLIGYIPQVMSVYRLHSEGTWTQKSENEKLIDMIESIDVYNEFFDFVYDCDFQEHKNRLISRMETQQEPPTLKAKLKNTIKGYTPPIVISLIKLIIPPKMIDVFRGR